MLIKKLILLLVFTSVFANNINTLLEEGFKNNYKIKSYNHQIISKDYAIKKSKSKYYPSVNFSASITHEKYREEYPNGYKNNIKDKSKYYGIKLQQVIFDKSIFPNVNDAKLKKEATIFEKESFVINLYQQILSTYFQVLTSNENLKYVKLKKDNYLNILNEIQEKERYHIVTKTDLIQAKSNYVSASNEYIKAKVIYENYLTNLKLLLLTQKDLQIEGKIKNNIDEIINEDIVSENKEKIINNPSLKEEGLYIKIAKNNINGGKASYYPTIYLQSSFYQDNHDNTASDQKHLSASLTLNWNLFSGEATTNAYQETKQLLLSAINDYNYKKITLELDFNENLTNLKNNLEILKSDKDKIEKTKEYLLRAQESLKYKTISLTDYYIAQNDYYQAIIDFNKDKLNTILYYIKLLVDTNELKEKTEVFNNLIN